MCTSQPVQTLCRTVAAQHGVDAGERAHERLQSTMLVAKEAIEPRVQRFCSEARGRGLILVCSPGLALEDAENLPRPRPKLGRPLQSGVRGAKDQSVLLNGCTPTLFGFLITEKFQVSTTAPWAAGITGMMLK